MLTAVCQEPDVTFGPSHSWHGMAPIVWEQLRIYPAQSMPHCNLFIYIFLQTSVFYVVWPDAKIHTATGINLLEQFEVGGMASWQQRSFCCYKERIILSLLYPVYIPYLFLTNKINHNIIPSQMAALWLQRRNLFHHKWLLRIAFEIPYPVFQWLLSQQI